MLHSISEILKAATAYLQIQRRTALAIFLASVGFTIAELASGVLGHFGEWWTYVVPVIVFSGTMFFYRTVSQRWKAARERRRNELAAISAIDELDQAETSVLSYIYHRGGSCRVRNNVVFAELERLHVLNRVDPLGQARTPIWQIPGRISRALRRKIGRPDATKSSGQPPWRTW